MANFKPLNDCSLFLLEKIIKKYKLGSPFLDVACGNGYVSKFLAKKGWTGVAIDYSSKAVSIAKQNLTNYKKVKIKKITLMKTSGKYKTILMFDVLEHIKNDVFALKKMHALLKRGGHLIIAGPSNPKEWRWDDDFYGHYRRYTKQELETKLIKTGFKPIIFYDYTFPFFWIMRRFYTKIKKQRINYSDNQERTKNSSTDFAWNISYFSAIFNRTSFIWIPIYFIQYLFFRNMTSSGNSFMVVAEKQG